jgi:hypothetical protein
VDALGLVERLEFHAEGSPQLVEAVEEPVAHSVFDHVPELFDGVKFRAGRLGFDVTDRDPKF